MIISMLLTQGNKPTHLELGTLESYEKQAVKLIYRHSPKAIVHNLIQNEDVISLVINALINADCTWSPDGGASPGTFRYNAAYKVLIRIIQMIRRDQEVGFEQITDLSWEQIPTVDEEKINVFEDYVKKYLDKRTQDIIFEYYFNNKTLKECGMKYNITKQYASVILNEGIRQLRYVAECENSSDLARGGSGYKC